MEKMNTESLVNTFEAAEFLRIQPNTLRIWVMRRTVPFMKAGGRLRFRISSLAKWAEEAGGGVSSGR